MINKTKLLYKHHILKLGSLIELESLIELGSLVMVFISTFKSRLYTNKEDLLVWNYHSYNSGDFELDH